jgi:hypothetical protein
VRRLLRRRKAEGEGEIIHRLRGRPSNGKISAGRPEKILAEVRSGYRDFGPTLASEQRTGQELLVSRKPRRQCIQAMHVWRERRAAFWELVLLGRSPLRWLEERGPVLQLIAVIDDATSCFRGRFTEHDSTEGSLRMLDVWLRHSGRRVALFTDKNSIVPTRRPVQWAEQLEGEPSRTQFERVLHQMGIEPIGAHSPQAKGRIERLFGRL